MVRSVASLGAIIDDVLKSLPDLFQYYWPKAVDVGIRALNQVTDAINNMLAAGGLISQPTAQQTAASHIPTITVPQSVDDRVTAFEKDLQGRLGTIGSTNYLDQIYKNGLSGSTSKAGGSKRDPYAEMMTSAANDTRTLQAQAAALGQTTQQTAYLDEKQKLLNKAYQDNIKLSPDQLAAIDDQAKAYANAKAQLELMTELYDTGKQATEDFFSAMKDGLESGEGLWGSLGDAASKALDDIANKALQMAADGVWNMIFGAATGGSGGGGIVSSLLGLFGGGTPALNPGVGAQWAGPSFASGTSFAPGGLSLVGEHGPELVNLSRGSQVFSNPASMAMMGAANQNSVAINLHLGNTQINGSGLSAGQLMTVLVANNQRLLSGINSQLVPAVHDALGIKQKAGTRHRNSYFTMAA
jgi:uncharacterized protein YbjQ (UPF0145 family)